MENEQEQRMLPGFSVTFGPDRERETRLLMDSKANAGILEFRRPIRPGDMKDGVLQNPAHVECTHDQLILVLTFTPEGITALQELLARAVSRGAIGVIRGTERPPEPPANRDITFEYEGVRYVVGPNAYDEDLVVLPDGRVLCASNWSETLPPQDPTLTDTTANFPISLADATRRGILARVAE